MERPRSIIGFERTYLGGVAIGLVNTALSWNQSLQRLSENPGASQFGPSVAHSMLAVGTTISVVISLALWFFTAHRRTGARSSANGSSPLCSV